MKNAIYDIDSCGLEYKDRFNLYKRVGFKAVGVCAFDNFSVHKEDLQEKINFAKSLGLEICDYHFFYQPSNDLWDINKVDAYISLMLKHLHFCKINNIKNMTFHASESKTPPPPNLECAEKLNQVVAEAEKIGVNLCVENVISTEHFVYVLENCNKNLKICIDTGHANINIPEYEKFFETYKNRVYGFHLHDNAGKRDEHQLPMSDGGTFNWSYLKNNFCNAEYATLEIFSHKGKFRFTAFEFEELLKTAIQSLQKIF